MPRPFDIEFLAQIKWKLYAFADHLVDDHPVVDALHFDLPAVAVVVELSSLLVQIQNIHGFNGAEFFGQKEIWQGLLPQWINLHQNDVLGSVPAEYGAAEELAIGIKVQPREENA